MRINIDEHQEKIRTEFEKLEEARRIIKGQKVEESFANDPHPSTSETTTATKHKRDSDDEEDDEEFKYADNLEMPGQKLHLESKQRISVRNLRMREDTAKYLLNLDPNSAYYDPKSRSMRDNPFADTGKDSTTVPYIGDNYVRYSGEANRFAKSQMFAWEAYEKGVDVHQQADPTKLELLHKEFKERYEQYAKNIKASVLEKYGGAEYLDVPPKELLFAQTEQYTEYSRYGNPLKSQPKAVVKSKYIEDNCVHNHKSVWGSYWNEGKWGYKCCKSLDRESYCDIVD